MTGHRTIEDWYDTNGIPYPKYKRGRKRLEKVVRRVRVAKEVRIDLMDFFHLFGYAVSLDKDLKKMLSDLSPNGVITIKDFKYRFRWEKQVIGFGGKRTTTFKKVKIPKRSSPKSKTRKKRGGGGRRKNYYRTLGIKHDATVIDIKKAFRRLAKKWHPDVCENKKKAEEKFKEIAEAYETLSDNTKRSMYDQTGEPSPEPTHPSDEDYKQGVETYTRTRMTEKGRDSSSVARTITGYILQGVCDCKQLHAFLLKHNDNGEMTIDLDKIILTWVGDTLTTEIVVN